MEKYKTKAPHGNRKLMINVGAARNFPPNISEYLHGNDGTNATLPTR
jgi:hypothetical protein